MKTIIASLLASCAVLLAQTNTDSSGYVTNSALLKPFAMTNSSGKLITNAVLVKLTPNKFIYKTPNGGGMLLLASLSKDLQEKFGYDPQAAQAAEAAEKAQRIEIGRVKAAQAAEAAEKAQRIEVARAQYLASWRGTNRVIQVEAVVDAFGQCETSVGNIYITNLPPSINVYPNPIKLAIKLAEASVWSYADQVEIMTRNAKDALAAYHASQHPRPNVFYEDPFMSGRANQKRNDAEDAARNLSAMRANLRQMQIAAIRKIVAYPTARKYNGLSIWQYVETVP